MITISSSKNETFQNKFYIKTSKNIRDINTDYVLIYDDTYYGFDDNISASMFYKNKTKEPNYNEILFKGLHLTYNYKNNLNDNIILSAWYGVSAYYAKIYLKIKSESFV